MQIGRSTVANDLFALAHRNQTMLEQLALVAGVDTVESITLRVCRVR